MDLSLHNKCNNLFIVGKRECGKTTLVKDLLNKINCHNIIVLSSTEEEDGSYKDYKHIHRKYSSNLLDKIIVEQEINPKNHIVLIVDNLTHLKEVRTCDKLLYILKHGKSIGITIIITYQYSLDINIQFREFIDYLFVFDSKYTYEVTDKHSNKIHDLLEKLKTDIKEIEKQL